MNEKYYCMVFKPISMYIADQLSQNNVESYFKAQFYTTPLYRVQLTDTPVDLLSQKVAK